MDQSSEQIILGELRAIKRQQAEMALQMRVDTPWTILQDNLHYFMITVSAIPLAVRALIVSAVFVLGAGLAFHMPRLTMMGLDLLILSIMFVRGE